MDEVMTIEGLTAIGLAPPAEGIPPPPGAATGDPFANAFAAAMAASAGKTDASGTASTVSVPPGLVVDPESTWLVLLGTPAIEGAPNEQGAVEISRPDRSAEADIEDAMMASTLALAGLLGLERPVVATPPDGTLSGAGGDVTVLAGEAEASIPVAVLEVAADGGEAPTTPAPRVDVSGIEVPVAEVTEPTLPRPEAGANRAAVANVQVPAQAQAQAQAAAQAAGVAGQGVQPGRPEERLGEVLQDVAPTDRSEVASAWNRAGGSPQADDATTDSSSDGAGAALTAEVVDDATLSERGNDASVDGVDASTTGEAGQAGQAVQSRIEVSTAAGSMVETTVDASDGSQLVRGLADTVHRATRAGENELRLVLNPPELGHLDVRVEHGQNGVRILIAAESASAHDLIQQHLPALRAALEARDLRIDRIDVQASDSSSNLGDSGDPTQRRQDGSDEQPRWSSVAAMEQAEQQATGEAAPVTTRERGGSGLLDLVA